MLICKKRLALAGRQIRWGHVRLEGVGARVHSVYTGGHHTCQGLSCRHQQPHRGNLSSSMLTSTR